uniref:EH domain-containing protein n=1 Tax=Romanomermis culicivorax TaxID=13658 RepID=A0A915KCV7_ROMCU
FVSAESSSLYVIGDPSAVETPSPQPPYGGLSPQPPFEESESNQFFPVAAAVLHQPSTAPTSHHGTPSKMSSTLDTQSTNRPASQPSGAAPGQQIFQQQSTQYQSYGVAFDPQFTSNVPDPNVYKNLPQQTGFNSWMPDSTSQQVVQQQPSYAYQQQTSALNQFGDLNVLAPQKPGQQKPSTMPAGGKLIKGDLDSTLANLAQNLNISKGQDALKKWIKKRSKTKNQSQFLLACVVFLKSYLRKTLKLRFFKNKIDEIAQFERKQMQKFCSSLKLPKPVQWNPQQKPAAFQAGFTPQQGPPSGYGYQQQPMAPGWGAPQPMMMGQNAQYGMQMPYG